MMILYQLVKWMEERKRLKLIIAESGGDNQLLQVRKEQVEQHMLLQASRWLEPEQEKSEPFLDPFMVESLSASEEFAATSG